jgi:ATP-dependent Clp protease ATP-binding subunit ClpX
MIAYHCSFCGASNMETSHIVQGDGAAICNECMAICVEMINNKMGAVPAKANWPYGSMGEQVDEGKT